MMMVMSSIMQDQNIRHKIGRPNHRRGQTTLRHKQTMQVCIEIVKNYFILPIFGGQKSRMHECSNSKRAVTETMLMEIQSPRQCSGK